LSTENTDSDEESEDEFDESEYQIERLGDWRTSRKNWRPITGADEMDGWTSLHLACHENRWKHVNKYVVVSPPAADKCPDQSQNKGVAQERAEDDGGNIEERKNEVDKEDNISSNEPEKLQVQQENANSSSRKMIKYDYSGSNINTQTEDGETPLFVACRQGHRNVVNKLLAYKDQIDVNLPDHMGRSPLSVARERGHVDVERLLLRYLSKSTSS
jgi:ankyrin repeat protein